MKFELYRVFPMPAWLLKIQSSNFIHNEVTGGRKWPELLREKDGTAVPLFCSTWWGHCRAPRFHCIGRKKSGRRKLVKFSKIFFHTNCINEKKYHFFMMACYLVSCKDHFIVWEGKCPDNRSGSNLMKY